MRKVAVAILVADVVGSTALLAADEAGAIRRIAALLDGAAAAVAAHGGRVFSRGGDALLAAFPGPEPALQAARAAARAGEAMRFGLHFANVFEIDSDFAGVGVNVAALIEMAAAPGAVEASGAFVGALPDGARDFDDLGARRLPGLADPIRVHRLRA